MADDKLKLRAREVLNGVFELQVCGKGCQHQHAHRLCFDENKGIERIAAFAAELGAEARLETMEQAAQCAMNQPQAMTPQGVSQTIRALAATRTEQPASVPKEQSHD